MFLRIVRETFIIVQDITEWCEEILGLVFLALWGLGTKLETLDPAFFKIDIIGKKMFRQYNLHESFLRTNMKTYFPIKVFAKHFPQKI